MVAMCNVHASSRCLSKVPCRNYWKQFLVLVCCVIPKAINYSTDRLAEWLTRLLFVWRSEAKLKTISNPFATSFRPSASAHLYSFLWRFEWMAMGVSEINGPKNVREKWLTQTILTWEPRTGTLAWTNNKKSEQTQWERMRFVIKR